MQQYQEDVMPRRAGHTKSSLDTVPNFLKKTSSMLEKAEYKNVISWSDDGKYLVIKNPSEFSLKILPKYFKHSNLASFVRQLNMYNFKKQRSGINEYIFFHEMFQRDQKELLTKIKRKKTESVSPSELTKIQSEANEPQNSSNLLQENEALKKVHVDLNNRVMELEQKISDLSSKNLLLASRIEQIIQYNVKRQMTENSDAVKENAPLRLTNVMVHKLVNSPPSGDTGSGKNEDRVMTPHEPILENRMLNLFLLQQYATKLVNMNPM